MVGRLADRGDACVAAVVGRVADRVAVVGRGRVEVGRKVHYRPVRQQQRGEGERGGGEEVRAVEQDDGRDGQEAKESDGCEAEPVERFALLCGQEDDQDGDGDEEDYKVQHFGWMDRGLKNRFNIKLGTGCP